MFRVLTCQTHVRVIIKTKTLRLAAEGKSHALFRYGDLSNDVPHATLSEFKTSGMILSSRMIYHLGSPRRYPAVYHFSLIQTEPYRFPPLSGAWEPLWIVSKNSKYLLCLMGQCVASAPRTDLLGDVKKKIIVRDSSLIPRHSTIPQLQVPSHNIPSFKKAIINPSFSLISRTRRCQLPPQFFGPLWA